MDFCDFWVCWGPASGENAWILRSCFRDRGQGTCLCVSVVGRCPWWAKFCKRPSNPHHPPGKAPGLSVLWLPPCSDGSSVSHLPRALILPAPGTSQGQALSPLGTPVSDPQLGGLGPRPGVSGEMQSLCSRAVRLSPFSSSFRLSLRDRCQSLGGGPATLRGTRTAPLPVPPCGRLRLCRLLWCHDGPGSCVLPRARPACVPTRDHRGLRATVPQLGSWDC